MKQAVGRADRVLSNYGNLLEKAEKDVFESRGWHSFEFQREVWRSYLDGKSGLVHAATGNGKTLAVLIGPMLEWLHEVECGLAEEDDIPMTVLWITPLRSLAQDTLKALEDACLALRVPWRIEARTGDTGSAAKAKQLKTLPACLVTTPESLSVMLSRPDADRILSKLKTVIADEWHELMGTKRGVQTELCLARLRSLRPQLRTWGLSATIGNLEQSLRSLVGVKGKGALVRGFRPKQIVLDSVLPETIERFPWAGHLGIKLLDRVIDIIEASKSVLIFCNVRSATEIWYQAIIDRRPDFAGIVALHHGSLDNDLRRWVENGLREGKLRAVVCTSSLDLGVDFSPVDRVVQIGSAKGVARLLQRAGRSGHQPDAVSRITCVPTHALELVEIAACRDAIEKSSIESRQSPAKPLDLLSQHAITLALGGGFDQAKLYQEVITTAAYENLSEEEWQWVLTFITSGGTALGGYPDFKRVSREGDRYWVKDARLGLRHRMSIGTITSDASMHVQFLRGQKLGTVEESFISRLKPGDRFSFAGRNLELIFIREMIAWVKLTNKPPTTTPRWMGGRLPLSSELSKAVRQKLDEARNNRFVGPEMERIRPLMDVQSRWSNIPQMGEFLVERLHSREGHHLFFYPFEGRLVNQGLACLFAYRLGQVKPISFTIAVNDYGFELLSPERAPLEEALASGLLIDQNLLHDIPASLNAAEMAKRQFREIARISGLIFQGYPGKNKTTKQIQASSGLFYDVFQEYDPGNMLLVQAHREVLETQLEQSRLTEALRRLALEKFLLVELERPTPFGFPLLVDRLREKLTTEALSDRVKRMQLALERKADEKPKRR
jgi:ATP-dependent Lhr-like helicase